MEHRAQAAVPAHGGDAQTGSSTHDEASPKPKKPRIEQAVEKPPPPPPPPAPRRAAAERISNEGVHAAAAWEQVSVKQSVGRNAVERFIEENRIDASAADLLWEQAPEVQQAVLDEGPVIGRNVSALTMTRIKRAKASAQKSEMKWRQNGRNEEWQEDKEAARHRWQVRTATAHHANAEWQEGKEVQTQSWQAVMAEVSDFKKQSASGVWTGVITEFDENTGFGWIDSPEAYAKFNKRVYLHRSVFCQSNAKVGDTAEFIIHLNKYGSPQVSREGPLNILPKTAWHADSKVEDSVQHQTEQKGVSPGQPCAPSLDTCHPEDDMKGWASGKQAAKEVNVDKFIMDHCLDEFAARSLRRQSREVQMRVIFDPVDVKTRRNPSAHVVALIKKVAKETSEMAAWKSGEKLEAYVAATAANHAVEDNILDEFYKERPMASGEKPADEDLSRAANAKGAPQAALSNAAPVTPPEPPWRRAPTTPPRSSPPQTSVPADGGLHTNLSPGRLRGTLSRKQASPKETVLGGASKAVRGTSAPLTDLTTDGEPVAQVPVAHVPATPRCPLPSQPSVVGTVISYKNLSPAPAPRKQPLPRGTLSPARNTARKIIPKASAVMQTPVGGLEPLLGDSSLPSKPSVVACATMVPRTATLSGAVARKSSGPRSAGLAPQDATKACPATFAQMMPMKPPLKDAAAMPPHSRPQLAPLTPPPRPPPAKTGSSSTQNASTRPVLPGSAAKSRAQQKGSWIDTPQTPPPPPAENKMNSSPRKRASHPPELTTNTESPLTKPQECVPDTVGVNNNAVGAISAQPKTQKPNNSSPTSSDGEASEPQDVESSGASEQGDDAQTHEHDADQMSLLDLLPKKLRKGLKRKSIPNDEKAAVEAQKACSNTNDKKRHRTVTDVDLQGSQALQSIETKLPESPTAASRFQNWISCTTCGDASWIYLDRLATNPNCYACGNSFPQPPAADLPAPGDMKSEEDLATQTGFCQELCTQPPNVSEKKEHADGQLPQKKSAADKGMQEDARKNMQEVLCDLVKCANCEQTSVASSECCEHCGSELDRCAVSVTPLAQRVKKSVSPCSAHSSRTQESSWHSSDMGFYDHFASEAGSPTRLPKEAVVETSMLSPDTEPPSPVCLRKEAVVETSMLSPDAESEHMRAASQADTHQAELVSPRHIRTMTSPESSLKRAKRMSPRHCSSPPRLAELAASLQLGSAAEAESASKALMPLLSLPALATSAEDIAAKGNAALTTSSEPTKPATHAAPTNISLANASALLSASSATQSAFGAECKEQQKSMTSVEFAAHTKGTVCGPENAARIAPNIAASCPQPTASDALSTSAEHTKLAVLSHESSSPKAPVAFAKCSTPEILVSQTPAIAAPGAPLMTAAASAAPMTNSVSPKSTKAGMVEKTANHEAANAARRVEPATSMHQEMCSAKPIEVIDLEAILECKKEICPGSPSLHESDLAGPVHTAATPLQAPSECSDARSDISLEEERLHGDSKGAPTSP